MLRSAETFASWATAFCSRGNGALVDVWAVRVADESAGGSGGGGAETPSTARIKCCHKLLEESDEYCDGSRYTSMASIGSER